MPITITTLALKLPLYPWLGGRKPQEHGDINHVPLAWILQTSFGGYAMSQDISSHGIDEVLSKYFSLDARRYTFRHF